MSNVTRAAAATGHASPKDYEGHWQADGSAYDQAPKWAKYRTVMAGEFPSPYRSTKDPLARQIGKFVAKLDQLRPEKGGPAYLGDCGALTYTYPEIKNVEISQEMGDRCFDAVAGVFGKYPGRRICLERASRRTRNGRHDGQPHRLEVMNNAPALSHPGGLGRGGDRL